MDILRFFFIAIATLAAFGGASSPAAAAESYDSVGFIDALPATITTQGTWCLRQNLDTSATSGNAIEIQTNNVTIDCNGFRMRGSGGGASTTAVGIFANGRVNITIRHCTIRGFQIGIEVTGGSGKLVEDNLLDQHRFVGIATVGGSGSVIRRNIVTNSGGSPATGGAAAGIYALGDVIDNVVDGVSADSLVNFTAYGIYSPPDADFNFGIIIQGNRIRNLTPKGTGTAIGISSNGTGVSVRDNAIGQASLTTGFGVACADNTSHVRDNVILHYGTGIGAGCSNAGGNSVD